MGQVPNYIKVAADDGNLVQIAKYLESLETYEQINATKEHKLLLRFSKKNDIAPLVKLYLNCITKLSPEHLESEVLFVDFIIATSPMLSVIEELIYKELKITKCENSLFIVEQLCKRLVKLENNTIKKTNKTLSMKLNKNLTPRTKSTVITSILHSSNGRMVNLHNACNRLINICVKYLDVSGPEQTKNISRIPERVLDKLISLSSFYETILFLQNQVSFGEFKVMKVDWDTGHIELDFVDKQLQKARRFGIRNSIMQGMLTSNTRQLVQTTFEQFTFDFLNAGFESGQLPPLSDQFRADFVSTTTHEILRKLDIEDELLLLISKDTKVTLLYLTGLALSCCTAIATLKNSLSPKPGKKENIFYISPIILSEYLSEFADNKTQIYECIDFFCNILPTTNTVDFRYKPYLKLDNYLIAGLLPFANKILWPKLIKKQLVTGGKISKDYGKTFENYIQFIFESYGWNVLAEGFKIQSNNQTITDIDLIVYRDGLILLIQIKSISDGESAYEYWRARDVINKGIKQARLSKQYFDKDLPNFVKLLNIHKNLLPSMVEVIQPLVVVSSKTFTGWKDNSIPVVSLTYLISVLNGARIKFIMPNGENSNEQEINYLPKNPSSSDMVNLLFKPFDWNLADSIETTSVSENLCGFTFKIPDFKVT